MQFQEEGSKMFEVHGPYKQESAMLMFSQSCSQQPFVHLDRCATCITLYLTAWHLIPFAIWLLVGCDLTDRNAAKVAVSIVYKFKVLVFAAGSLAAHMTLCPAMQRFMEDLKDNGTIENQPSMQGRTMYMIIGPQKV